MGAHAQDQAPRYAVGIDLGTTNCSMASLDLWNETGIHDVPIPQLIADRLREVRDTLPSFAYLPMPHESQGEEKWHCGVWAREQGAVAPGRLIHSAKSWLCHGGVDRTSAILPWHAPPDVQRCSPVNAAALYLAHMRATWDEAHPDHPLHQQHVVITVPASFDEVARELTIDAARRAGLPSICLVEEPLAAFYAWLSRHEQTWEAQFHEGDRILICDIGGGTTDFSLIEVRSTEAGLPVFHRIAVGEHLILGGDNLDLALAHAVEERVGKLDARVWSRLVRACRAHKEAVLSDTAPSEIAITVEGSGASILKGAQSVTFTRAEVESLLVDGFLPSCGWKDNPQRRASGFQEFGLPYARDPGITKYLASFLRNAATNQDEPVPPKAVLLNGGFFAAPALRQRLLSVLSSWFSEARAGWSPVVLDNERLDLAVSRGAAYFGGVRQGRGVSVSTNLARSYFLELESTEGPKLICAASADMEEGQSVDVPGPAMTLTLKSPVSFPLYVSSMRTSDRCGDVVPWSEDVFTALPPLQTVLFTSRGATRSETEVRLRTQMNENGTLEIALKEVPPGARMWRLPFDVRAATESDRAYHDPSAEQSGFWDESVVEECGQWIRRAFDPKGGGLAELTQLMRRIEERLEAPRAEWPSSLLRRFAAILMAAEGCRRIDAAYEEKWLNWMGYVLRPGYGCALDDWRIGELWKLYPAGPVHANRESSRIQWWIMWRRVAGGLSAGQQQMLCDPLTAAWRRTSTGKSAKEKADELIPGRPDTVEALRLLGSMERLAPRIRQAIGQLMVDRIRQKGVEAEHGAALWALGRIGARQPMYGPLNHVLPPAQIDGWVATLLESRPTSPVVFALALMCRRTGDRFRDIEQHLRERVLAYMSHLQPAHPHLYTLVQEGGALNDEERRQAMGDSVPRGLRWAG